MAFPPPGCFQQFKEADLSEDELPSGEHEERVSVKLDKENTSEGNEAPSPP